jgi:hypothetical protein
MQNPSWHEARQVIHPFDQWARRLRQLSGYESAITVRAV